MNRATIAYVSIVVLALFAGWATGVATTHSQVHTAQEDVARMQLENLALLKDQVILAETAKRSRLEIVRLAEQQVIKTRQELVRCDMMLQLERNKTQQPDIPAPSIQDQERRMLENKRQQELRVH